jgi:hypothetical protein
MRIDTLSPNGEARAEPEEPVVARGQFRLSPLPIASSRLEKTAATRSAVARCSTAPHARSAGESPESLSREADEICMKLLLPRGSVDRQYVAQSFKWIKQNLRIKAFYGTSENAVKTQIWIAVAIYVLIAILKKRLKLDASMHTILQILSVTVFEKTPLDQALGQIQDPISSHQNDNQLKLFV